MKKALLALLAVIVILLVVGSIAIMRAIQRGECSSQCNILAAVICEGMQNSVGGANIETSEALETVIRRLEPDGKIVRRGASFSLLDVWGRELLISSSTMGSQGAIRVVSRGPDGEMGTADDISVE